MKIRAGISLGLYQDEDTLVAKIEALEDFIREANKKAVEVSQTGQGNLIVEDEVYDLLVSELTELQGDNPVLTELWDSNIQGQSDLNNDEVMMYHLTEHPMKSINTIKDLSNKPYQNFLTLFPYKVTRILLEAKLNGHGIRVVYTNGHFYKATSRARGTNGKDLTTVMSAILKKYNLLYIDLFSNSEITEIRGELVMDSNVFEANRQVINAVSPLFAVASLSRDSASFEEKAMLDFIPYRLYMIDEYSNPIIFDSREDEFDMLQESGFYQNSPALPYVSMNVIKEQLSDQNYVDSLLDAFTDQLNNFSETSNFGYFTDGVVLEVDDTDIFTGMGADVKYDYGNVALKIGAWNQSSYTGYVQMIRWTPGKSKLTPTAVVSSSPDDIIFEYEDVQYQGYDALNEVLDIENYVGELWNLVVNKSDLGVLTANGSKVTKVPIYEPNNIIKLELSIGAPLSFNFGGEAGVVPLTQDGNLLTK